MFDSSKITRPLENERRDISLKSAFIWSYSISLFVASCFNKIMYSTICFCRKGFTENFFMQKSLWNVKRLIHKWCIHTYSYILYSWYKRHFAIQGQNNASSSKNNDCLPCLSILVKTKSLTTLRLCDIHIFQYIVALHLIDPRVYRIGLPLVQNYSLCGDGKFTQL